MLASVLGNIMFCAAKRLTISMMVAMSASWAGRMVIGTSSTSPPHQPHRYRGGYKGITKLITEPSRRFPNRRILKRSRCALWKAPTLTRMFLAHSLRQPNPAVRIPPLQSPAATNRRHSTPLWIPAFAGMTEGTYTLHVSCPRSGGFPTAESSSAAVVCDGKHTCIPGLFLAHSLRQPSPAVRIPPLQCPAATNRRHSLPLWIPAFAGMTEGTYTLHVSCPRRRASTLHRRRRATLVSACLPNVAATGIVAGCVQLSRPV